MMQKNTCTPQIYGRNKVGAILDDCFFGQLGKVIE